MRRNKDPSASNPANDILTVEGCQALLHIGEKALATLMARGLPYVEVANSYRFVRTSVLAWMASEAERPKARRHPAA